jgi:hypothetical protein
MLTERGRTVVDTDVVQGAANEVRMSGSDEYDRRNDRVEENRDCFVFTQEATDRRQTSRDRWSCLHMKTVDGKCLLQGICTCGVKREGVCTYTTSRVPASETEKLRDVLEVSGASVVQHAVDMGIAVAIKAWNGLGS